MFNGGVYTHYSSPNIPDSTLRIQKGQYSNNYAPIKFILTNIGSIASSNYKLRIPLIKSPSANQPLTYVVSLIGIDSTGKRTIYHRSNYLNLVQMKSSYTLTSTTTYIYNSNNYVQSTMSCYIHFNSYSPDSNH